MKKQPDFRQLFDDFFGRMPKKVSYSIRADSNRFHDLVFLTSLIHDARFKPDTLKIRGKRLIIQLERDCWELGFAESKGSSELYIADSILSISPVYDLEWRFLNGNRIKGANELWILDVIIERKSLDILKVVLDGDGWSLHMKAFDADFKMGIQDREVPYLYSQKSKSVKKHS
jgi:hypothetical protein